ncbi:MAG: (2Fe-2S) ferredoxin domain-containing protein [Methylophilaceae bacterium]
MRKRDDLKKKIKAVSLSRLDGVRVNNTACLDCCGQGSVLVIYPEETRYQYKTKEDIDEIFERHIKITNV